ncbi:hypothetical protein, partial [Segatella copri]|uniref:hypothetical protein n=1 Tax=Segatella copri TaxID=165179 RepID=UPI001C700705
AVYNRSGKTNEKIDAPVNTAAKVTLSPNGGDFQKTISVTATLSNNAKSGWYKIGDGEQVALTPGKAATFTLGEDMLEGESKTVTWSATNAEGVEKTGTATFNKKKEVVIPTPTGIFAYFLVGIRLVMASRWLLLLVRLLHSPSVKICWKARARL